MLLTKLNNGVEMPMLGFGVFQISDPDECERAVAAALEAGYRLIDTAASYGNEEAVGRAIARSGVARQELFLTTKLWIADAGEGRTRQAFQRSLDRLGVDYLDLYLIHQPFGDVYGAWRDMQDLYREGRVRAIGVSNFQPDRLMDLTIHNEIRPAMNQVECHPFHQQTDVQQFLDSLGVQMEAWAPFAEGQHDIFENAALRSIAERHHKSVPQVILRWLMQRGVVAIPKSVRRDRIQENFAVFDFELSDADMTAISELDTHTSSFFDHRDPVMVQRLGEMRRDT